MQETLNPDLFVAKWYCGFIHSEDLPEFAADALEAGYDGPALRRLAGLIKPASTDIVDLFEKALAEIGTVKIQNAQQAAVLVARSTARDILQERIDPFRGAACIARLAPALDYPAYLMPFYEFEDVQYWGEYAPPRAQLIKQIMEEVRVLLAGIPE